jgi:hypothetical protein
MLQLQVRGKDMSQPLVLYACDAPRPDMHCTRKLARCAVPDTIACDRPSCALQVTAEARMF